MEIERTEPEPIAPVKPEELPALQSPFIRAPERARTVFLVTSGAAAMPLMAGAVLFGWRSWVVAGISIVSCVLIERLYYRVSRVPALLGRSHAFLTGLLIALTLPAHVPWYIPLVAAAFAIIVGKAIFGGVGHFLWQPALVGRLAVTVMFPLTMTQPFGNHPNTGPVLAQERVLVGNVRAARRAENYRQWRGTAAPQGADAFILQTPSSTLGGLTSEPVPAFSALAYLPDNLPQARPAAFSRLPLMAEMFYGIRPGGIGETCVVVIVIAGLYLVYRNYVKLALPLTILLAAAIVTAAAPVKLAGPNETLAWVFWPMLKEGLDVGLVYVTYQLLSFELVLAAFFLAPEMTSRPITTGGQVLFGIGAGALAMVLKLYLDIPIPAYMAVLAMNTLTPVIDVVWRPRVFGQRRWWRRAPKAT